MCEQELVNSKLILQVFENETDIPGADNLDLSMCERESHLITQFINEVETIIPSIARSLALVQRDERRDWSRRRWPC